MKSNNRLKTICIQTLGAAIGAFAAIWLFLLFSGAVSPIEPGGGFGFSYPNFTGCTGCMTAQQFVGKFAAAMHNPNIYQQWIKSGTDIRKLNPAGVYLKHLNLRTINTSEPPPSVEGNPDYIYIEKYHPEWILRDANGNTVPLYSSSNLSLDFGNPAYLAWAFGTWFPNEYFDSTDKVVTLLTWYLEDNGNFQGMKTNCGTSSSYTDTTCRKYTTDSGMQTAWKALFDTFHSYYPYKKIMVSTTENPELTPAQQLSWKEDVLKHSDGYFSEYLTNNHAYWGTDPNNEKRNCLYFGLGIADWCAANNKYFFPNLGMADGQQPTQAQINYGFAFFNLSRSGNGQFFSIVTKDNSTTCSGGCWQPRAYPEMNLALGSPLESRVQIATNVWRRKFQSAAAYVNLSDSQVSIQLPVGNWKNSLGQGVKSPLVLASFSGLTVYQ